MNLRLNVRREVLFLLLYTALCNVGTMSLGTILGYSSVVLPVLTSNTSSLTLSATEMPLFASLPYLSQIVGSLLCLITMKYGRRCSMIASGAISSLGWIIIASSYNVTQLIIGRMLTGTAIGLCSTSVTVYLEEISTSAWREILTIMPSTSISFGILIVYLLGFFIQEDWRLIAVLCIIPPTLFVLCNIFFIPESPGWLLTKGRKKAARLALLRLRSLREETVEFQKEFSAMVSYNERSNEISKRSCQSDTSSTEEAEKLLCLSSKTWSKLKNIQKTARLPEVWKPLVILIVYFFFQQFSGLYVMIVYAVDMIIKAKITLDPFLIAVILGVTTAVVSVITTCCSARIDRRTISIVSGVGMSISMGVLGVYMQFFENANIPVVPLVCIIVFMATGTFGFLLIPWAMIGELYPTKYVSVLGPLTTFFGTSFGCIAVQLYPMMVTQSEVATIYFYCVVCITATIFLTIMLPETRGKTKTQIEDAFRGKLQIES